MKNCDVTLLSSWRGKCKQGGYICVCVPAKFSSSPKENKKGVSKADELRKRTICVLYRNKFQKNS